MNGTKAQVIGNESISETRSNLMAGGSTLESFGAVAAMALAIVGLAGVWPTTMAGIAAIVVGAATILEGMAYTARITQSSPAGFQSRWFEGSTADLQGGVAVLVLGILALLGIAQTTLLAIAVITLGVTYLLSARLLTGLAGVVLGILAVVGLSPATLILAALLCLGAGLLFSGSRNILTTFTSRTT